MFLNGVVFFFNQHCIDADCHPLTLNHLFKRVNGIILLGCT